VAKKTKGNFAGNLFLHLEEMSVDEELVLANLVFEPVIIGRQLIENHFSVSDFQGLEANRALLGAMLHLLEADETLNLANLLYVLNEPLPRSKKTRLEQAGGEARVSQLFLNPFSSPGITMCEDIEPVIVRIRDRNMRIAARKIMIEYSEKMMSLEKEPYETLGDSIQALRGIFLEGSAGYVRNIEAHIEEMQEIVDLQRKKRQSYLGLETNFPILMENLNGFQKEFYLITSGVGMGKSTFATQLAWDLVVLNPEVTVLYFSLDLNRIDVTAKIISQAAELPIDYVKNPYSERPDLEEKRQKGINVVASKNERLKIIDESTGRLFIEDIKKKVRRTRLERGGEIAVVIDPLFKILLKNQHSMSFSERCNLIASELKSLAAVEGVCVIATAGMPKAISNRRPVKEDLEEIMGLLYDPYAIFFLYCDYLNNFDTPFLEWEWGKEDSFMIPITEAFIAKNKMGAINSRIFYRYFEAYSKFKECAPQEVENYSAMIDNLEKFSEAQGAQKNKSSSYSRQEEF
jgi:replicative DNA helicase